MASHTQTFFPLGPFQDPTDPRGLGFTRGTTSGGGTAFFDPSGALFIQEASGLRLRTDLTGTPGIAPTQDVPFVPSAGPPSPTDIFSAPTIPKLAGTEEAPDFGPGFRSVGTLPGLGSRTFFSDPSGTLFELQPGGVLGKTSMTNQRFAFTPTDLDITTPTKITGDVLGGGIVPDLPEPTALISYENFLTSFFSDLASTKATFIEASKTQLDDTKAQLTQFFAQQAALIKQGDPALDPFRSQQNTILQNQIDAALVASKTIQTNFEQNQLLVNRLETLLTEGQATIQQIKGVSGLVVIREPRIQQAIDAVTSEVTVIEALLNVRQNQISTAHSIIEKGFKTATAERQDRIDFLNAVIGFESDRFTAFTAAEEKFMEAQIDLLKFDLDIARTNMEDFKRAFSDPDTAQLYYDAGVTMFDSVEVRNRKLAEASYSREVVELSNAQSAAGLIYLAPGQAIPAGAAGPFPITDSRGVTKNYYEPKKATKITRGTAFGTDVSQAFLNALQGFAPQTPTEKSELQSDITRLLTQEPPEAFKKQVEEDLKTSVTPEELRRLWEESLKDILEGTVGGTEREEAGVRATIQSLILGDSAKKVKERREEIVNKIFSDSKELTREEIERIFDELVI